MKSQIYTVPPTPVQEYQEALIFLWMIFLFTTITLLGLLTPHSGRCLSGCPGHSDNFHSRPSSGPGHSGRYLSGCSPGNSHSWSSSSPGHSDRCLSIPISLLTEEDCERTGSELEWSSNSSMPGEREESGSWSAQESSRWRSRSWWGSGGCIQHGCVIRNVTTKQKETFLS